MSFVPYISIFSALYYIDSPCIHLLLGFYDDRNDITLTMAMRHCHPMERFKHNMVLPAGDSCDSFIDSIYAGTYIRTSALHSSISFQKNKKLSILSSVPFNPLWLKAFEL